MDRDDRSNIFRYTTVVLVVIVFVILYVWQNIEVMRMKMSYRDSRSQEIELIKKNDRLRYEISKLNRLEAIRQYARSNGLRPVNENDITILKLDDKSEQE